MQYVLLLLLATALSSPIEAATLCAVPPSIEQEFRDASAVFMGTVTRVRVVKSTSSADTVDTIASMVVEQRWKGATAFRVLGMSRASRLRSHPIRRTTAEDANHQRPTGYGPREAEA